VSGLPEADLGSPTTLLLARHARTGETDRVMRGGDGDGPDLDAAGREQADRLAWWVSRAPEGYRPVAVISSPALRARRTARAAAAALGLESQVHPDWAEVSLGDWDGLGYREISLGWPDLYRQWQESATVAPPGGESLSQVSARVAGALEDVVQKYAGQAVLVISHSAPVRTVLAAALDCGPSAFWRLRVDPASVSVMRWWADGNCEVAGVNTTPPLW
jgi:broad specificity phosphatase PhoE